MRRKLDGRGMAGVSAITFAFVMIGASHTGFRLNCTDSAPHGIWMEKPLSVHSIQRGMWVSVCPPVLPVTKAVAELFLLPHGDCQGLEVVPLLKPVAAVPGDTVRIRRGEDATVNGVALPNTASKQTLPAWPDGEYIVKGGEVWVFSSHSENSFDSRYFGPASMDQVRGKAIPFLVADKS